MVPYPTASVQAQNAVVAAAGAALGDAKLGGRRSRLLQAVEDGIEGAAFDLAGPGVARVLEIS